MNDAVCDELTELHWKLQLIWVLESFDQVGIPPEGIIEYEKSEGVLSIC